MVEHCFWEAGAVGSNPITSTYIHTTIMQVYSVKHWEENWEELIDRVENGEHIGIRNEETGHTAVMIPADDELMKLYRDSNNEAS